MKPITPHLWFDTEAIDAVRFYTSLFPGSRIVSQATLSDVPSPTGKTDVVSFELAGRPFMAINAGPYFRINPSISFFLRFDGTKDKNARENLDRMWQKLSDGGTVLMELAEYPFSERYGWVQDRYGVSWQVSLKDG